MGLGDPGGIREADPTAYLAIANREDMRDGDVDELTGRFMVALNRPRLTTSLSSSATNS